MTPTMPPTSPSQSSPVQDCSTPLPSSTAGLAIPPALPSLHSDAPPPTAAAIAAQNKMAAEATNAFVQQYGRLQMDTGAKADLQRDFAAPPAPTAAPCTPMSDASPARSNVWGAIDTMGREMRAAATSVSSASEAPRARSGMSA